MTTNNARVWTRLPRPGRRHGQRHGQRGRRHPETDRQVERQRQRRGQHRGADELDPRAIEGGASGRASARVLSGLGVIPRVVGHGREIRHRPLPRAEAMRRIDDAWRPYHRALEALMDEARGRFGQAILIDVHSMPREALLHLQAPPPEIVLGDRNGASADPASVKVSLTPSPGTATIRLRPAPRRRIRVLSCVFWSAEAASAVK